MPAAARSDDTASDPAAPWRGILVMAATMIGVVLVLLAIGVASVVLLLLTS